MNADKALSIGTAIVAVAAITTVVAHKNSAKVITAIGKSFSSSLRAAMGN